MCSESDGSGSSSSSSTDSSLSSSGEKVNAAEEEGDDSLRRNVLVVANGAAFHLFPEPAEAEKTLLTRFRLGECEDDGGIADEERVRNDS